MGRSRVDGRSLLVHSGSEDVCVGDGPFDVESDTRGLPRSAASAGVGCSFWTEPRIVLALLVSSRLLRLFAWRTESSPVVIVGNVVVSGMNVGESRASGQLPR
jgi:hypothetical protein